MSQPKVKKVNKRNNTRSMILLTSILILASFVILFLLYITVPNILNMVLPFGMVLVAILSITQFVLLLQFFHAIKLIDNNANQLSQGQLNVSDIMADRTRGLETLTIAFNDMKRNLLDFIETTKSNVIVLSDAVDRVMKSLDMNFKGNEQIATNMATVSEKAQDQLKIVKDTLDSIEDMSVRINNISATLERIEQFVGDTVEITEDGSSHLDKYVGQMDIISSNLADTTNFIDTLNGHLKEIDQVGKLIINITEQLKLLSLNSSVEAARAGEAGKGFVVVAQEMNKLSAATRESIGQINDLLQNIMSSNEQVSQSIGSVSESFNTSKEIFHSVKVSFDTINKNANILNKDMKKVYEESRVISNNTQGIRDQGHVLHDASNEISSITQDVAAVTQEQLAENEEINSQAHSLQKMLSGIETLLKRYKTSVTPVQEASERNLRLVMVSLENHPFWNSVRQGALYAENELKGKNVTIDYITYDKGDHKQLIANLGEKIEQGCDGLILPGFIPGIEDRVAVANSRNIPVIAYNCDFNPGTNRLSYFGPDIAGAGRIAGELMAKAMEEEGQYAFFCGDMNNSINQIRRDAAVSVLKKYKNITLATEIEISTEDEFVYKNLKEVLQKFHRLKGVIITSSGVAAAAKAIEQAGRIGQTKIVCFDYEDEIIELIRKGIVYAALGQDPFGQGHDPIIYLYNYLVAGEKPEDVTYTRTEIMDIRNVGEIV